MKSAFIIVLLPPTTLLESYSKREEVSTPPAMQNRPLPALVQSGIRETPIQDRGMPRGLLYMIMVKILYDLW